MDHLPTSTAAAEPVSTSIAAVAVSCSAACVCCVVATDLLFDVVLLKLTNFSLLVESNQSTSISF